MQHIYEALKLQSKILAIFWGCENLKEIIWIPTGLLFETMRQYNYVKFCKYQVHEGHVKLNCFVVPFENCIYKCADLLNAKNLSFQLETYDWLISW